ncbi:transcription factor E2F8-like isoform X2 [Neocloeon triangulifer]|uniref:transcription factor E2F8-like isoform X2 n=1 Tax=Neocloeon triangulifer TaxID=2078957 RepID=UPI00286EC87C|nr:transcription factor E2F8-like isoform X2 [Neocloeon triangulifer]
MSEEISSSAKTTTPPMVLTTPLLLLSTIETKDDANLRKNKSLLAICKKFLEFYPLDLQAGSSMDIPLEVLADKLGLSRRRLYDIINVMESLQMAVKVTKNLYRWYGLRNVKRLLNELKQLSDQNRLQELDNLEQGYVSGSSTGEPPTTPTDSESARELLLQTLLKEKTVRKRSCVLSGLKESPEPKGPHTWKNKSLGGTCLKFLTLFFKHETVSLEWAGKVLLCGEDEDNAKQLRNKVRRIYDVANVLSALGLVCKITPKDSLRRRLFYGYCGPAIDNLHSGEKVYVQPSEPPMPGRRIRNSSLTPLEPKAGGDGICKRKLMLGSENGPNESKKLLKEEDLILGTNDLSAFSILLAVAENERLQLERAANEINSKASEEKEIDLLCSENQLSTKDLEYIENRDHLEGDGNGGRSALRSLLETNQPPKVVVCPEPSGPKESLLIKNGGQMLRKTQLSIPFRTNGPEVVGKCSSL